MELCSEHDTDIAYEGKECPICVRIRELDADLDMALDERDQYITQLKELNAEFEAFKDNCTCQ